MKKKIVLYHIIGWILYLSTVIFSSFEWDIPFWIGLVSTHIPLIILCYTLLIGLFPTYLPKKKYFHLTLVTLIVLVVIIFLRFFLYVQLSGGTWADLADARYGPRVWNEIRFAIPFVFISLAIYTLEKNGELKEQQNTLLKEVSEAKLSLLKNQINPHFLYNTLSFIYTKSLPLSAELSQAILILSQMMRYALNEADQKGKVNLEQEVAHLENFISIHQLRFQHNLAVEFKVEGDTAKHKIPPLLFITFVENAFKHGKVTDKNNPILIHLIAMENKIRFYVFNQKTNGIKEISSGIGLQNIKKRLTLLFPGQHDLQIIDKDDSFTIDLTIENTAL